MIEHDNEYANREDYDRTIAVNGLQSLWIVVGIMTLVYGLVWLLSRPH